MGAHCSPNWSLISAYVDINMKFILESWSPEVLALDICILCKFAELPCNKMSWPKEFKRIRMIDMN